MDKQEYVVKMKSIMSSFSVSKGENRFEIPKVPKQRVPKGRGLRKGEIKNFVSELPSPRKSGFSRVKTNSNAGNPTNLLFSTSCYILEVT